MRTKIKQDVSPVLSVAPPKAPREIRQSNSSLSCWKQIITWAKGVETTEKQDEKTHRKLPSQVYILLFRTLLGLAKYENCY